MALSKEDFSNRREHARKSVLAEAIIEYGGNETRGKVHDISVGGAKIEAQLPADAKSPVNLKINQFGAIPADIAWQRGNQVGLKFRSDPEQVAEMLAAIAIYG